jgi:RNA polymerase sigma-70 factor (ECF subfamily)
LIIERPLKRELETVQLDIHEDLIQGSIRGDRKAQYRLYQLYAKAMFNVCARMMPSHEDAEDMLQESFTEAFRRLHTFRFESTFGAWLKRIVVNRCINEIRRKKTDLKYFEDMHLFEGKKDEEEESYGLSAELVKKAMKDLPGGSRMIFSLYLLEGYDHLEIAEILNISVSNSKSQYMRARQRVKELLTQMNYEN